MTLHAAERAVDGAPIGTVLAGCYELRERLGAGGMAMVYRAYDHRLQREVAIKMPRPSDDRARIATMFEREVRIAARLNHDNIVTLHRIVDHDGGQFAVLELLVGETLAERLDRCGALSIADALPIFDGVLAALAYIHEHGVVHRDLKPGNVFLTADQRVKLLDFGVAIEHAVPHGTRTRAAGTPGYMAPEHSVAPDPRNDIWAAATLFLECVTGRRPAPGATPVLPAELPRDLRAMLARAVSPDPVRRPSTARDMRTVLIRQLSSSRTPPPRRRRRRGSVSWLVAAVCLFALAGGAIAQRHDGPDPSSMKLPNSGRWRGDPPAGTPWETQLQRIDDTHFLYKHTNRLDGHSDGGTLTLEQRPDGVTVLSGKVATDGTCRNWRGVGFIEFVIVDGKHIIQNRAAGGKTHDHYTEWWPVYPFKWEGPLRDVARR